MAKRALKNSMEMKQMSFQGPLWIWERLRAAADARGVSVSQLVSNTMEQTFGPPPKDNLIATTVRHRGRPKNPEPQS
jgi:hypothetical protein